MEKGSFRIVRREYVVSLGLKAEGEPLKARAVPWSWALWGPLELFRGDWNAFGSRSKRERPNSIVEEVVEGRRQIPGTLSMRTPLYLATA